MFTSFENNNLKLTNIISQLSQHANTLKIIVTCLITPKSTYHLIYFYSLKVILHRTKLLIPNNAMTHKTIQLLSYHIINSKYIITIPYLVLVFNNNKKMVS